MIAVIAAVDWNGGFSRDGKIPWYFPEDFKHFRTITTGGICIMGRTTYDDINERLGDKGIIQVLPGRLSIVLTSKNKTGITNAIPFSSMSEVIDGIEDDPRDVFFIGGKQIFEDGILYADVVYLTMVQNDYHCDLFFPMEYLVKNFTIESERDSASKELKFIKLVRKGITNNYNRQ